MAKDSKPQVDTYKLKEHETKLLVFIQQKQQAIFSGILSTIVADRLGFAVTDHTQFKLNAELTEMEISELEPTTQEAEESPIQEAK